MFDLAKLSFRACNLWDSMFGYLISKLIMPVINIVIFYNIGKITNNNSVEFALRSVLIIMLITIVNDSIIFIQSEKRFNTLSPILITPINSVVLYLNRISFNYISGLVMTWLYFIAIVFIFGISITMQQMALCLLHLFALSIPIMMLSIIAGYWSILTEEVSVVTLILYNGLLITSGLFKNVSIPVLHWLTPIKAYTQNIDRILEEAPFSIGDFSVYLVYLVIYVAVLAMSKGTIDRLICMQGAREE